MPASPIPPAPDLTLLLTALDQAYDEKAWHGANLRGSLRGVTPELAAFRPAPDRHNIQELAVHAAYWKYVVRRKLLGEKRGSFPVKGSNWFPRTEAPTAAAWRADLALLEEAHRTLRAAVAAFAPRLLPQKAPGSRHRYLDLLLGAAAHDVYHAGQIQLLKRLAKG